MGAVRGRRGVWNGVGDVSGGRDGGKGGEERNGGRA